MKLIIVAVNFIIITILFYKAAGTLSFKKINIITYSYYSLIAYSYIGASLVYLGFREHYLIQKISNEAVIDRTFFVVVYTSVCLAVFIIFFNRIFSSIPVQKRYSSYLQKNTVCRGNEKTAFFMLAGISVICLLSVCYVFYYIGYVPLFKIFDHGFDRAVARIDISRNFRGNIYIKNIVMLSISPLISYLAYVFYRITKKTKWKLLFFFMFVLCIFIKTYDFSKSPILNYLIGFYLIEIMLGSIKSIKYFIALGLGIAAIIIVQYGGIKNVSSFLSISNGPLGRIFISQPATLFLHLQTFPEQVPFLNGASLPTALAEIAGIEQSWVRSGRVVMEVYNPAGIAAGSAGVMNAVFAGEAYANWGMPGVMTAPVLVSFILALIFNCTVKSEKNPFNIVIYIALLQIYAGCLQGGFVDFLYNVSAAIIFLLLKWMLFMRNHGVIKYKIK